MRNFKKFLALVLAMLMLVGATVITTGAAEEGDYSDAAQRLAAINILKGDTNGNLMLDQGVTRWHTALFFVQALTGRTDGAEWNAVKNSDIFNDVPEYGTAIDYAAGIGLIKGRGDGIYGYGDPIIYQDMLVMAVRALGYETKDMSYPYGHIMAAEKLELNKNLAKDVNYKDALTRGETAQIIWNMLGTETAFVDPLTKKVLYPGEFSLTGQLGEENGGKGIKRTTMLEEAGFAHDVIESVIVDFTEGKLSTDINTVQLENGMVLNADDLGITEKTRKDTYMNLPVSLYINCKVADFEKKYDAEEKNEDAQVIFTELLNFTSVVNLGDETNIKFTAAEGTKAEAITLGGNKFAADKYDFDLRVLEEDGWVEADEDLLANFLYDTKDGQIGGNSYGEIRYTVLPADEDVATDNPDLLMLYMPFAFGRYQSRSIRYTPTVKDTSFVLVGTYDADKAGISGYKDKSERSTFFVERLLGENFVTDGTIVDVNTTSISERDGKASATVTVTGESIKNNQFMFYYYNALDNVLNVAKACDASKTGVLSAYSAKNETVKVDGKTYTFGFSGSFENTEMPAFNPTNVQNWLKNLTTGEKNVTYIAVDDHIVYLGGYSADVDAKQHSFVILSVDAERMAELLDISVPKYEAKALADGGLYRDDNGNAAVAALNVSTGKWELAAVKDVEFGAYDEEEDEFEDYIDIADGLENYKIFGTQFTKYADLTDAIDMLKEDGIFMVRANKSKVYTVAPIYDDCIEFGTTTEGIVFSDAAAKTNLVKAVKDVDVDPARLTLSAKSVVVLIDSEGEIGVRTGIQKNDNSVQEAGRFYSATNTLIVLKLDGDYDVKAWEENNANSEDETYYLATKDADTSYARLEDETYEITVSGLFNLRTFKAVDALTVNVEDLDEATWMDGFAAGTVLHLKDNGDLVVHAAGLEDALLKATDMRDDDDEDFATVDMTAVEFIDDSTFKATDLDAALDGVQAVAAIDITLATLDLTEYDFDKDYDLDDVIWNADDVADEALLEKHEGAYSMTKVDAEKNTKPVYYISGVGEVAELSAPEQGKLNQYIIDTVGADLLAASTSTEDDYFENAAELQVALTAVGQFDKDTGVLTLYVVKTLVDAD